MWLFPQKGATAVLIGMDEKAPRHHTPISTLSPAQQKTRGILFIPYLLKKIYRCNSHLACPRCFFRDTTSALFSALVWQTGKFWKESAPRKIKTQKQKDKQLLSFCLLSCLELRALLLPWKTQPHPHVTSAEANRAAGQGWKLRLWYDIADGNDR